MAEPAGRPRVAVLGGGIAGLVAAHFLGEAAEVTIFEAAPRLGGHVHAVTVAPGGGPPLAVEAGFLAFHRSHYPVLTALLDAFGVATAPSGVGLAIWDEPSGVVCDQADWFSLFGDRLPAAGRAHLADLVARLYRHARRPETAALPNVRLDAFLAQQGYDPAVARYVLIPSISALWGFQPAEVMAMSARTVAESLNRFFVTNHAEPFERIAPSTDAWLAALRDALPTQVRLGAPATQLRATPDGVTFQTPEGPEAFDGAVVATHADEALALLAAPDAAQARLLAAFPYHRTTSVVHTDPGVLPPDPAGWTDYNYRARARAGRGAETPELETYTTWDMRRIQGLPAAEPVLVTVGPRGFAGNGLIAPDRILAVRDFSHPASPPASLDARPGLAALNAGRLAFCGSYFGTTGSNECAVASARDAARALLTALPR